MIDMLLPFISNVEPRSLPPYQTFLNSQKILIASRVREVLEVAGYTSRGINLLKYILQLVDIDYFDRKVNNYERYSDNVRFIYKDLVQALYAGRKEGYTNLFIPRNQFVTKEYLIPIADTMCITNLPFYTEDWSEWKKINPLLIWSHDSTEYNLNILNDRYHFKYMPPSYCVELLDIVGLIFKYYSWLKHYQIYENNESARIIPMEYFLHKYVLCPTVWNLADIWLLHLISQLLTTEDVIDFNKFSQYQLESDSLYGRVSLNCRKAFEYLYDLTTNAQKNLKPDVLLSSKIIFSGSLHDRIQYTSKFLLLPGLRKMDYLRWLRDRDSMKIYLAVWKATKNKSKQKTLFRHLSRMMNRKINEKPWKMCTNYLLQTTIENEMLEFRNSIPL